MRTASRFQTTDKITIPRTTVQNKIDSFNGRNRNTTIAIKSRLLMCVHNVFDFVDVNFGPIKSVVVVA